MNRHRMPRDELDDGLLVVGLEHIEADHLLIDIYSQTRAWLHAPRLTGHHYRRVRRLDATTENAQPPLLRFLDPRTRLHIPSLGRPKRGSGTNQQQETHELKPTHGGTA